MFEDFKSVEDCYNGQKAGLAFLQQQNERDFCLTSQSIDQTNDECVRFVVDSDEQTEVDIAIRGEELDVVRNSIEKECARMLFKVERVTRGDKES